MTGTERIVDNDSKRGLFKDFFDYNKENLFCTLLSLITVLFIYGKYALSNGYYIDAADVVNRVGYTDIYYSHGRFAYAFTRNVLGAGIYNSYLEGILGLLLTFLFVRLLAFLFKSIDSSFNDYLLTAAGLLVVVSTVYEEHFYFKFQICPIAVALILEALAMFLLLDTVKQFSAVKFIAGILLLIYSFGTYQALVVTQIVLYFSVFLVYATKNERGDVIKLIKYIFIQFFSAFIVYEILVKLFFSYGLDYLNNQIMWFEEPFLKNVRLVLSYVKNVLVGNHVYYSRTYSVALIFFAAGVILSLKRNKEFFVLRILSALGLIASPFFMPAIMATYPALRAQLSLILANGTMFLLGGFFILEYYKEHVKEKVLFRCAVLVSVVLLYIQSFTVMRLFYTHDVVLEHDKIQAERIVDRIEAFDYENKPVVFIGCLNAGINVSCYTFEESGSYMSLSSFELRGGIGEASNFYNCLEIHEYLRSRGFNYIKPTGELTDRAVAETADMPYFPAEGSVKDMGDYIAVRLSKDANTDFGR